MPKYNFNGDTEPYGYPKWVSSKNLFPDIFPDLDFPDGILLKEDADMLLEHARGKGLVVDFGTFLGLSAAIMSMVCEKVITIDVYQKYNGYTYQQVQDLGLSKFKNVVAIEGDANIIARTFSDKVDLLFIDAIHDYKNVSSNYIVWFPHVKVGGEILFHDYQAIHPDIVDFVKNEVMKDCRVKVIDKNGTIIAFEKVSEL